MSAAAAVDERVLLERPEPRLAVVRVRGNWALRDGIPPAGEIVRELEAEPPDRLRFEAAEIGEWDSALVTFVQSLAAFAAARGIAVDTAALPPGVRKLVELALAVKPRSVEAPETDDAGARHRGRDPGPAGPELTPTTALPPIAACSSARGRMRMARHMAYVVRFVQRFRPAKEKEFLALEREFARLERKRRGLPRGRRLRPFAGRDPSHTLVWESEFETLAAAEKALATLAADPGHGRLLRRQIPFFLEAWTEIYEVLEL